MTQDRAMHRSCSRAGCTQDAVATLTYDYQGATAVLGPLSVYAEPHCYDLCATHTHRFSAPRGWQVISQLDTAQMTEALQQAAEPDDLLKLANAVREAAQEREPESTTALRDNKNRLQTDTEPAKPKDKQGWLRLITSGE